jgi:hypothetical protein
MSHQRDRWFCVWPRLIREARDVCGHHWVIDCIITILCFKVDAGEVIGRIVDLITGFAIDSGTIEKLPTDFTARLHFFHSFEMTTVSRGTMAMGKDGLLGDEEVRRDCAMFLGRRVNEGDSAESAGHCLPGCEL